MKAPLVALSIAGALFSSAAHADVATSLTVGTTGVGAHLVAPYSKNVNMRLGLNAFNYSTTETTSNATYDTKAKLQTVDALVDYHPGGSAFRLTGGAIYNGNEVEATARPTVVGTYTFNGQTYTAASAGTVTGTMEFNKVAPYLGIGFGSADSQVKGWGFSADLGVMFQGEAKINLTSNNCTAGPACDQLASDLAAESVRLRNETRDYRFYPVARVGISYRF